MSLKLPRSHVAFHRSLEMEWSSTLTLQTYFSYNWRNANVIEVPAQLALINRCWDCVGVPTNAVPVVTAPSYVSSLTTFDNSDADVQKFEGVTSPSASSS